MATHAQLEPAGNLAARLFATRKLTLDLAAPLSDALAKEFTQRTGVTVGANVGVGANSVLLPGITIGDNSLVAAGSVVSRDVPANEIWGGVPARKLKDVPTAEQVLSAHH